MPDNPTLIAPVNVSEGEDQEAIEAIGGAFAAPGARLLDVHSDADHGRSVFTVTARATELVEAIVSGAREALRRVDLRGRPGVHPRVGAVDVAPVAFIEPDHRGAACAAALTLADRLGRELRLPVFLYGLLAVGRTRAELRRGGESELAIRIENGELTPDFGPSTPTSKSGCTLVGARPPLVAFNLALAPPATLADARAIAAAVREGGAQGLPGVRAIGLELERRGRVQLSFNVEDPNKVPLRTLVAAVRRSSRVQEAELVGLAPAAAFDGFPEDLPIPGFDPELHLLERRLQAEGL